MTFSDGYEIKVTDRGHEIFFEGAYLETAVSPKNASDIVAADKANRETIRKHKENY